MVINEDKVHSLDLNSEKISNGFKEIIDELIKKIDTNKKEGFVDEFLISMANDLLNLWERCIIQKQDRIKVLETRYNFHKKDSKSSSEYEEFLKYKRFILCHLSNMMSDYPSMEDKELALK